MTLKYYKNIYGAIIVLGRLPGNPYQYQTILQQTHSFSGLLQLLSGDSLCLILNLANEVETEY